MNYQFYRNGFKSLNSLDHLSWKAGLKPTTFGHSHMDVLVEVQNDSTSILQSPNLPLLQTPVPSVLTLTETFDFPQLYTSPSTFWDHMHAPNSFPSHFNSSMYYLFLKPLQ